MDDVAVTAVDCGEDGWKVRIDDRTGQPLMMMDTNEAERLAPPGRPGPRG